MKNWIFATLLLLSPALCSAIPVSYSVTALVSLWETDDIGQIVPGTEREPFYVHSLVQLDSTDMRGWEWHPLDFWQMHGIWTQMTDDNGNIYDANLYWLELSGNITPDMNPNLYLDHLVEWGAYLTITDNSTSAGGAQYLQFTRIDTAEEPGEEPGAEVPEPASIALLGLGLAGLAWRRRPLQ